MVGLLSEPMDSIAPGLKTQLQAARQQLAQDTTEYFTVKKAALEHLSKANMKLSQQQFSIDLVGETQREVLNPKLGLATLNAPVLQSHSQLNVGRDFKLIDVRKKAGVIAPPNQNVSNSMMELMKYSEDRFHERELEIEKQKLSSGKETEQSSRPSLKERMGFDQVRVDGALCDIYYEEKADFIAQEYKSLEIVMDRHQLMPSDLDPPELSESEQKQQNLYESLLILKSEIELLNSNEAEQQKEKIIRDIDFYIKKLDPDEKAEVSTIEAAAKNIDKIAQRIETLKRAYSQVTSPSLNLPSFSTAPTSSNFDPRMFSSSSSTSSSSSSSSSSQSTNSATLVSNNVTSLKK